ncbi:hypothetical protein [Thermococcus sp.]|uniref:hypothetical protein n=1 Tax=Thermococcus sp. TaxID=35749 RepID=UPI002637FBEA|nr:hypothetical protein [Thermococcus sp.]
MGINLFIRGGKGLLEREALKQLHSEYMEALANIMKEDEDAPFNMGPVGSWPEIRTIPVGFYIKFGTFSGVRYPPPEWKMETADAEVLLADKRLYIFTMWTSRGIRGKKIYVIFAGLPHYAIKRVSVKEGLISGSSLRVDYDGFYLEGWDNPKEARFWMTFKSKKKDIDYLGQKVSAAQLMASWFELLSNRAKKEKWDVEGILSKEDIPL